MAEISVIFKQKALYQLLLYALQHAHSQDWVPAIYLLLRRLDGVR
jgi:hypothetical protein